GPGGGRSGVSEEMHGLHEETGAKRNYGPAGFAQFVRHQGDVSPRAGAVGREAPVRWFGGPGGRNLSGKFPVGSGPLGARSGWKGHRQVADYSKRFRVL